MGVGVDIGIGAIGLIEISGLVASMEALDSMLKAANVEFLTWEKKLGGRLVTIIVNGSVSDVSAAIEAGKQRGSMLGKVVASAVIPRPHEQTVRMVKLSSGCVSGSGISGGGSSIASGDSNRSGIGKL
jgi:ethanolamine utilization protein EutM